jgi:hypothetical protein
MMGIPARVRAVISERPFSDTWESLMGFTADGRIPAGPVTLRVEQEP